MFTRNSNTNTKTRMNAHYSQTGCSFDGNFANFRRNIGILVDSFWVEQIASCASKLLSSFGTSWQGAFSIYRKIPENSGNFSGKCLLVKDVLHLTHSSHHSQAPFTVRCISRQNTKWQHNCWLLLIQMMILFLSWRRLQPIWGAIFTEIKVFMKVFCLHIRSMNLKATSGWWLGGPLKLCAERYKPQEEFLNNTRLEGL